MAEKLCPCGKPVLPPRRKYCCFLCCQRISVRECSKKNPERRREAAKRAHQKLKERAPEKLRERKRRYKAKHPEKVKEWKRRSEEGFGELIKSGLTPEQATEVLWLRRQVKALYRFLYTSDAAVFQSLPPEYGPGRTLPA